MVTAEEENAREIDPKRAEAVICKLEGASSDGRALRNASLEGEAKGDPM